MMQMLKMWAKNGVDATVLNVDVLPLHIDQAITSIDLSYSLRLEQTREKKCGENKKKQMRTAKATS